MSFALVLKKTSWYRRRYSRPLRVNLLSVGRLVTVLNEADKCGVVRKLQELDRGVFRCAVIRVEGEKQWGENAALRGSSAGGAGAG